MKLEKDGLHVYRVAEKIKNDYFLSVEYSILRHNQPQSLLPVLLREKDGESILFYDVTGRKNMMELNSGRGLSLALCREFLISLDALLGEMEELMLLTKHISFMPDCIYRTEAGSYQWMYCPDEVYDITAEVQSFFGWMLSEIDYSNEKTVRMIYHTYWSVRNRSLSRALVKACLNEGPKEGSDLPSSYEDFFSRYVAEEDKEKEGFGTLREEGAVSDVSEERPEVEEFWKRVSERKKTGRKERRREWPEEGKDGEREKIEWEWKDTEERKKERRTWNRKGGKTSEEWEDGREKEEGKSGGKRGRLQKILKVLCGIAAVAAAALAVVLIWLGGKRGMLQEIKRYLAGCLFVFAGCIYYIRYAGEKGQEELGEERGEEKEEKEEMWEEEGQEEGKTIQLDVSCLAVQPILKNETTGEICILRGFPFYVGKERGRNRLFLPDRTVSRKHAVIQRGRRPDSYLIQDLRSTNGTWVDSVRLEGDPVELKPGSRLRFAASEFCFQVLDK